MDTLNNNIKTTSLKDLDLGLDKSQLSKIQTYALLLKSLECLSKSNQVDQLADQISENTKCNRDSLITESKDLEFSEKPEIEATVKLLCEQIETLKQLLQLQQLELYQIQQELNYTNKELCAALNAEWLTLEEAKELVKKILVSKKPYSQSLAKLLSAIYNSTVKASELDQIDEANFTAMKTGLENPWRTQFEAAKTTLTLVRKQGNEIRMKSRILREQACEVKTQSREVKAQFNKPGTQFIFDF